MIIINLKKILFYIIVSIVMKEKLEKLPILNKINNLEEKVVKPIDNIRKILDHSRLQKIKNSEEKSLDLLNSIPKRNIFLEFVTNFLLQPRSKITRSNTLNQLFRSSSSLQSTIPENPKPVIKFSPSRRDLPILKHHEVHSNKLEFPSLKPSSSLNSFLEKEKNRLQAIKTERIITSRDSPYKEDAFVEEKKITKNKLKKNTSKKKRKKVRIIIKKLEKNSKIKK